MIIYKTLNTVNGKIYVGQDSKNDPNYLGSGKKIILAINKYGKDSFKKEILEHIPLSGGQTMLDDREIFWINELNSTCRYTGYNITGGGQNGYVMTDYIKKKISKSNTGKKRSNEFKDRMRKIASNRIVYDSTKLKMSNSHKSRLSDISERAKISERVSGENNPMFGKLGKDNPNYGRIMPADERDRRCGENNGMFNKSNSAESLSKMRKIIHQFDADGDYIKSWKSAKFASEHLNIPRSRINACCRGVMKKAGDFIWSYKNKIEAND